MGVLLLKEIRSFFSTITGYVVIVVFLAINSLFLWVLPGNYNIFDSGYATLDSFFTLAPWVFLFLIPAITMRSFSEEKRNGTIEFLFTKPVTDFQIILAKYLGALALVALALLPCVVFYVSVSQLGSPPGNLDTGGTYGAFLGLFFLAAIYVAIGIFASAITDNQIVAFIVAVLLCFFVYIGFDFLAEIPGLQKIDSLLLNMGINEHYKSISRGVLDSRDLVYYFLSVSVFLLLTRTKLQARNW
jgi:ABC-2 type transport system permease protein